MDDQPSSAAFTIAAPQLFDGTAMRGPALVTVADGLIADVSFSGAAPAATVTLPPETILAPGFIDIQVNGGGGILLNDEPSAAGISRIAAAHRSCGTTGLLPTLITCNVETMEALAAAAPGALQIPGVLGFHLEGPALNKARKGIHLQSEIRVPDARDLAAIKSFARFGRSLVTLAPECVPAALIEELVQAGLRIAAGHSDATAVEMARAADRGITGVTHLFNAMSQLTARAPGVVGAALDDERLFAGIICDGLHVDPVSLRLAFRCKGPDRLMLVTDAMPLVGAAQREFLLQGRRITLDNGRLTGPDGTLAGAHLTMIEAVRNAATWLGIDLSDALAMASRTPAMFLGLGRELGAVLAGYRADLVAFNDRFDVIETWIGGQSTQDAAPQQRKVSS
ncbi:N-acetylglucosamine-6-phosphate deacetylase [Bradyrhizobium sp.]|uniref:N-acetylglucosamine-6-phosphate deacetylase n=1 Tax=Bradyrhizobium sp. TaxID=376 RepID=UPI002D269A01|nr:N-acetylglucosamine-6-phosphate deacetylase [Bradyrhizobium sp.]HZR77064.1 N-acetylglucosamine-6-phosphate deacetylase [Bradyrhizobium sp.]